MATDPDARLRHELRHELRHRLRPMTGRDPAERGRSATPLELLYDLTYVIAFGVAAEQLADHVAEGAVGPAVGAYVFAIFSVSWAWMNFTWFTSAYDNDDVLLRVATLVQMVGVVVLTFGLPLSFTEAAGGGSPNNGVMVAGYVVMRVPLVALWLRAARQDPEHRRVAVGYAVVIAAAQAGWALTALLHPPVAVTVAALVALAVAELVAPVVLERRLGAAPWNAGHIAERFGLLTLITLGEVIAATTSAVAALTGEQGWSLAAVAIVSCGLVIAAALWWAYYLIPSREVLQRWPERTFAWRYANLPIFGAVAAVGAGLRVATIAVEEEHLPLSTVAVSLVVPTAAVLLTVFVTWSVLMHASDLAHVPLFVGTLVPLAAALVLGLRAAGGPIDPGDRGDTTALVAVIALVALAAVIEVVGHELVGYRHTVRVLEREQRGRMTDVAGTPAGDAGRTELDPGGSMDLDPTGRGTGP